MRKFQVLIFLVSIVWSLGQIPTVPTPETTLATTTTTTIGVTTTNRPPISIPTAPTQTQPGETTTTIFTTTTTAGSSLQTTTPPPETFQCPPTGVYYYPTLHCQNFVVCINGHQQLGRCQDGFLFDAIRLNCEPAGTVDCGDRTRPEGVNSFIFRF